MSDNVFHSMLLTDDDYHFLNGDATSLKYLHDDIYSPVTDFMDEESKKTFVAAVEDTERHLWFPARISSDGKDQELYFMKILEHNKTAGFVKTMITRMDDLVLAHEGMSHALESKTAMMALCNEIFFDYDPDNQNFTVYNAANTIYGDGMRPIRDFEENMRRFAPEENFDQIRKLMIALRTKSSVIHEEIDCNLINKDKKIKKTIVEGRLIKYGDNSEGVVGVIRAAGRGVERNQGRQLDQLTGLYSKNDIRDFAMHAIEAENGGVALAIIDVDYFKQINDTYGHRYGDEVLRGVAGVIKEAVGTNGQAGRFGGDEFLIVLDHSTDEKDLRECFRQIRGQIGVLFPNVGADGKSPLTITVGAAMYPRDAGNYDDLFLLADHLLYIGKKKGRNRYIIYTAEKHDTLEHIKENRLVSSTVGAARDVSPSEMIVNLFDRYNSGRRPSPEDICREFAETLKLDYLLLSSGEPGNVLYRMGKAVPEEAARRAIKEYCTGEAWEFFGSNEMLVVSRLEAIPQKYSGIKELFAKHHINSFVILNFKDKNDKYAMLAFCMIGMPLQWNQDHYKYYRAVTRLLSYYEL